jgi:predicted RNA binding protein YcfA (HicA-like mRNA interferase family)
MATSWRSFGTSAPLEVVRFAARAMKARELIRLLQDDGWQLVRTRGSHRQFKHATKGGTVTVAGNLGLDVPLGTLRNILKHAGLNRPRSINAIRSGD